MNTSQARPYLPAAAILVPFAAFLGAKVLLGAGPATAPAATPSEIAALPAIPQAAPRGPLSAPQAAALAWISEAANQPEIPSPLFRPAPPEEVPLIETNPIEETGVPDPATLLSLSAIIGEGAKGVASLDNRLRRIGEEVLDGWKIIDISASRREVRLEHTSGQIVILTQ